MIHLGPRETLIIAIVVFSGAWALAATIACMWMQVERNRLRSLLGEVRTFNRNLDNRIARELDARRTPQSTSSW